MTRMVWRKASRSNAQGGDCVEVATLPGAIGVRDSKNPGGGHLMLAPRDFAALVAGLKRR
ncbi:DUF397 domain-containing protein [Actinomadura macrotermitis]|uniref:DUF397 domain-containing protein n=1 Tax=Actinomadura macrotermitis TaxID=2585200 RepID=A0A7K0BNC6_9ACTN|nr:DUF397 domain-containing protein [Actinomadura macrotermitis]MQY02627.1 hypothetical protein [Actinomadura macrotermitis]